MKKTNQLKRLIVEEMLDLLKEDVNYNFNFNGKKMKVRFDVNSNPTKKGIKIQFTPLEQMGDNKQLMSSLQIHLNQKLGTMGMNVDFDPDVPYENVIGFTLKLDAISHVIMKALGGGQQLPDTKVHKSNDLNVGDNQALNKQQNPFKDEKRQAA